MNSNIRSLHRAFEVTPVIEGNVSSTLMFYTAAIRSITMNQSWMSPTGENGQMVLESWIHQNSIAKITEELDKVNMTVDTLLQLFEDRMISLMEETDTPHFFSAAEVTAIQNIQNILYEDPKSKSPSVRAAFAFDTNPGVSQISAPHQEDQQLA